MSLLKRKAGVLLHVSSLPSPYGIGTLGRSATEFVDFLSAAGIGVWQVLPIVPTGYGDSPYQTVCAGAVNPYFIDLDILVSEGLLTEAEAEAADCGRVSEVDYGQLFVNRNMVLRQAFDRFNKQDEEFNQFVAQGRYTDYSVFMALKTRHNYLPYYLWEERYRRYDESVVADFAEKNTAEALYHQFTQFKFLQQWKKLKNYANSKGVLIFGDMPIYLSRDSVEVWKYPKQFMLGETGEPKLVAGVPPDYFNAEGQLWGNPLYDWAYMKQDGYLWWNQRIKRELELYDVLRIDHFRGLARFYTIDSKCATAKQGKWLDGPGAAAFRGLEEAAIVAEDLGFIDDNFRNMLKQAGYPGMKVMEFGFDGKADNEHKPSNYPEKCVCYTGTHDNLPLKGYVDSLNSLDRKVLIADILRECKIIGVKARVNNNTNIVATMVELLLNSKARWAIIPMQDILAEGAESRMNTPALIGAHNWEYRVAGEKLTAALAEKLRRQIVLSQRI